MRMDLDLRFSSLLVMVSRSAPAMKAYFASEIIDSASRPLFLSRSFASSSRLAITARPPGWFSTSFSTSLLFSRSFMAI